MLLLFALALSQAPEAADLPKFTITASPGLESYYPLLTAIYAKLGYQVSFVVMPNERALVEVDQGRNDAQIGRIAGATAGYSHLIETSEALSFIRLQAWFRPSLTHGVKSTEGLRTLRVGGVIGNKLTEVYAAEAGLTVQWFATQDLLANMIQSGRLDAALLISSFTESPVARVAVLTLTDLKSAPVYHVLNSRHAPLSPKFDAALRELKSSGEYARLFPQDQAR